MSNLWALNATKKKRNDFVAGSSKWVSSELNNQITLASNSIEDHYHQVMNQYESLDAIMKNLNDNYIDFDLLFHLSEPKSESNEPKERQSIHEDKPDVSSVSFILPSPNPSVHAKESVYRSLPKGSPQTLKLQPEQLTINPSKPKPMDEKHPLFDDDSFQAISKAIRKSTAGKSASSSLPHKSESPVQSKSPKRESIPVTIASKYSLTGSKVIIDEEKSRNESILAIEATKAPIKSLESPVSLTAMRITNQRGNNQTISSLPSIGSSLDHKTPRSRSSAFVSLPAREPILVKSATKPKKITMKSQTSRVLDRLELESSFQETQPTTMNNPMPKDDKLISNETKEGMHDQFKLSPVRLPQKYQPKPTLEPEMSEITKPLQLSTPTITLHPKLKSPKKSYSKQSPIPTGLAPEHKVSTVWPNIENHQALSPVRNPPISPQKTLTTPNLRSSPERKFSPKKSQSSESLISRLTAPTNSSAAKSKLQPKKFEGKRVERNRFLTTSLLPSGDQKFNRTSINNRPKTTKNKSLSPIKHIQQNSNVSSIPPLRKSFKKSMMELRSEEAASKRKVVLNLPIKKHPKTKIDSNTESLEPMNAQPRKVSNVKTHISPSHNPSELPKIKKARTGNSIALPDAARGIYKTEAAKKLFGTPKARNLNTTLTQYSPNHLPEVLSDNDSSPNKKILQPWAKSPELNKTMLKFSNMNPNKLFPAPPKIDFKEIFGNDRLERSPTTITSSTAEKYGYDKKMGYH